MRATRQLEFLTVERYFPEYGVTLSLEYYGIDSKTAYPLLVARYDDGRENSLWVTSSEYWRIGNTTHLALPRHWKIGDGQLTIEGDF